MKIKCAITDDEPIARKGLANYINQIDFLDLVGQYENALDLNKAFNDQTIDLVFLDINMPMLSGLELLRSTNISPQVIITTAYPEHAIESFELNVLDYLLKPITFQRFFKSAQKARDYFSLLAPNKPKDYFFLRINKRMEKIYFKDILFLESQQNYVQIHLQKKRLLVHSTLKSLIEDLPVGGFVQTHKSYVVAKSHVQAIEGHQVIIGEHKIPISKYQRQVVVEELLK